MHRSFASVFRALAGAGSLLLACQPALAQNQIMKASVRGRVLDQHALPIPGADVRVAPAVGEGSRLAVTGSDGGFGVAGLSPGRYRVTVSLAGFRDFESGELELRAGDTLSLELTLAVAELAEQLTVEPDVFQRRSDYSSPANFITAEQIASLNAPTVEDVFSYQPSVLIRRRYIGDSNGTLGMRGANMFQTARSMVFADGVPIHNPLQTRWNGAPRWSLVAPDEVESAEVIYGPFSAEYAGSSMGGVVKLKTALPSERRLAVEGNGFLQSFDLDGAQEDLEGYRLFTSYGDRIGKLAFRVLYNRLDNASQPQSFNRDEDGLAPAGSEPPVTGAIRSLSHLGRPAVTYGDTGREEVGTHLLKLKGGYELSPAWSTRLTLAYESRRDDRDSPVNYLRDESDRPIWGDGDGATDDARLGSEAFSVQNALFGIQFRDRESVFAGWEVDGRFGDSWNVEGVASRFDILEDLAVDSDFNPSDPLDDGTGRITTFDDSGWTTLDLKLSNSALLGRYDLSFVTGVHGSTQRIGVTQYDSPDYAGAVQGAVQSRSGGRTSTSALFAQLAWRFHPDWELTLGARQEWWRTRDGVAQTAAVTTSHDDRDIARLSPKASIGFEPARRTRIQYSVGRAYRFPVPEELFDFEIRTFGSVLGDASLEPEAGIHHNLSIQHGVGRGHVEANLFLDDVDDTIFTQFQFVGGAPIFSFLPIDRVRTTGLELVLDQPKVLGSKLDLQMNATVLKSEILEHALRPAWVGTDFPRMPRARIGLFAVYNLTPRWLAAIGARYSSDQYGELGNADTVDDVFGSIDAYLFLDAKLSFRLPTGGRFSVGVDNLANETAFVYHPWPQRTLFAEFSLELGRDLLGRRP
jgi:iron complex outermembrane receptor protein